MILSILNDSSQIDCSKLFRKFWFWVLDTKLSKTMKIFWTEFTNSILISNATMIFDFSKYQSTTSWHNSSCRAFILCVLLEVSNLLVLLIWTWWLAQWILNRIRLRNFPQILEIALIYPFVLQVENKYLEQTKFTCT